MKKTLKIVIVLFLLIFFGQLIFHKNKAMPAGTNEESPKYFIADQDIDFLGDLTGLNNDGQKVYEQEIFNQINLLVASATNYILIDMFLFNDFLGSASTSYRSLANELVEKLVAKKLENPNINIDVITDPINTVYGGADNHLFERLKQAEIRVILTQLDPLRDSNPIYSTLWRTMFSWWGNSKKGWLKHPFSETEAKVSLRSYLRLLNFKANHRKVVIANTANGPVGIVASANPHNGSSEHSNVALKIKGRLAVELFKSEKAVAELSGTRLSGSINAVPANNKEAEVQLLTENKIEKKILEVIRKTNSEDSIMLAMFYLSDEDVILALIEALNRGVEIRIVLDPNKDAFGYEKIGIPNRSVAKRLMDTQKENFTLRWFDTHGEQFHTKMLLIDNKNNKSDLILGSANFTRRNLDNYNLETDVFVRADSDSQVINEARIYFNKIWENQGANYTVEYTAYQDNSWLKSIIYKIQENTGLSSF